jgi:hypothetical protein
VGPVLTHDRGDTHSVTASAPTSNTGSETRIAFWEQSVPPCAAAESCATWTNDSGIDQEGAVLRLRSVGTGYKAVTVTKNILYGAVYIFNVHVWDTRNSSHPFTQIGQFNLSQTFYPNGTVVPFPWTLCAETVGNTLRFIAWPSNQAQPAWGDRTTADR